MKTNRLLSCSILLAAATALAGCSLLSPEKVAVPPKVAKALDLAPIADGPDKGKVLATPEQARSYAEQYADKLAADEAKAKRVGEQKIAEAREKADAIAAEATRRVAKTKKDQARALAAVIDAQAEELEAIADAASSSIAEQLRIQREADRRAADALASIEAERVSAGRAFDAALADQAAREGRRGEFLSGAQGLLTSTLSTVGGPWGAAGVAGLGLVAGWLGLSKPGDKKRVKTATESLRSVLSSAKAADVLDKIDQHLPGIAENDEAGLIATVRAADAIDTRPA